MHPATSYLAQSERKDPVYFGEKLLFLNDQSGLIDLLTSGGKRGLMAW